MNFDRSREESLGDHSTNGEDQSRSRWLYDRGLSKNHKPLRLSVLVEFAKSSNSTRENLGKGANGLLDLMRVKILSVDDDDVLLAPDYEVSVADLITEVSGCEVSFLIAAFSELKE